MIKNRNRKSSAIRGDAGFPRPWLWGIAAQHGNKLTLLLLAFTGSGMQVQGTPNVFLPFTKVNRLWLYSSILLFSLSC